MNDDLKYDLVKELHASFNDKEAIKSNKIQKYSEATKTLYADEEVAKRKIVQNISKSEEPKKDDRTIDEMLKVLEEASKKEEKKAPAKRGSVALPEDKSVWHTNH